jgi:uncharacterized Zn finger protein (UPF0148 family)
MELGHCDHCGRPMRVMARFKFDHEDTDTASITARLQGLADMGVELGADVTLYACDACGTAVAEFENP